LNSLFPQMTTIDESLLSGKCRDRPICPALRTVLAQAGRAAGIGTIMIVSGGQPGSRGCRTGSSRHDNGRAADLKLVSGGATFRFTNQSAPSAVVTFVTEAAAAGAIGIGAGADYMGPETLHVGFGSNVEDTRQLVWGAQGRSANAPAWLRTAARSGWGRT